MIGQLLMRGLLAGLVAGILAFCFAYVFGEPSVDAAIVFEEQMAAAEPADPGAIEEEPLVSRPVQSSWGLLTGILILSVGLGGVFAILFACAYGRLGALSAAQASLLLAAIGFISFSLVPWLKYPANPPASTFDDTIVYRTDLYFLILAISLALGYGAWMLRQQLLPGLGAWNASVIAGLGYVVAVAVVFLIMPAVNETPETFPATVLWEFRIASLGIQFVLWAGIGLVFGSLAGRVLDRDGTSRIAAA
ncbi:Uncharacterized membrane protein, predicted cobalt tansporter CbtA [Paracoccus halophilus]|uniref:Uncharacterized membrane protein, predicted cobalt tansporter CbtA n=1 Tax=Paracoccus halophilus TaxID=376733 RepID=A0A099EYV9_9RHOB|nr:CbtA family protein [Paracoccus halophilus]KGJ03171.1 hypothetical protein IT41_15195 [Paracoccus halophilus]SFA59199.1 Uncharacterized membrane protein, predicted cobalt tansporter CbtA [Paracoccus halophilus]